MKCIAHFHNYLKYTAGVTCFKTSGIKWVLKRKGNLCNFLKINSLFFSIQKTCSSSGSDSSLLLSRFFDFFFLWVITHTYIRAHMHIHCAVGMAKHRELFTQTFDKVAPSTICPLIVSSSQLTKLWLCFCPYTAAFHTYYCHLMLLVCYSTRKPVRKTKCNKVVCNYV